MDRTVVLITGCSSGIGLHLALRLASDPSRSFKVYATLRDLGTQGPLWEAARSRGCPPGSLETLQLDVRDADSVAAARARVTEGRVDVLVCNAGRGLLGPLEAHAAGAVESVLDVNVAGTVRTLQAFLPDMKRRGSGRILGCHSTLFTAPASSRSRVCARAWRFCSRPSGSSESPPTPLSPASGDSSPLSCGSHSGVSLAPPHCGSHLAGARALAPRYRTSALQLGGSGPRRLGDWPKVTRRGSPPGWGSDADLPHPHAAAGAGAGRGRGALRAVRRPLKALATHSSLWARSVSLIECGPVRTAFLEKLEGVPGGVLDGADAKTRHLFSSYRRHSEQIFREAAQDPEEVTEVFLTALRAPRPALRYFSTERFLPLAHLRLADSSGRSYVAAMHRAVFADQPAEEAAAAADPPRPAPGAPPAAPQ
ncbi:17-beta-hydroxysteroid dehydrogenase type 1 isoform X1 [Canis aureus]